MLESDYILIQRLTNIRVARKLINDCTIERPSKLQRVLLLLNEEEDELCLQFEVYPNNLDS